MDKNNLHSQPLGLTQQELEQFFSGTLSGKEQALLMEKAGNCDLSELVVQSNVDIAAVNRIANGVRSNYPVSKVYVKLPKAFWLSSVLVIGLGIGTGLWMGGEKNVENTQVGNTEIGKPTMGVVDGQITSKASVHTQKEEKRIAFKEKKEITKDIVPTVDVGEQGNNNVGNSANVASDLLISTDTIAEVASIQVDSSSADEVGVDGSKEPKKELVKKDKKLEIPAGKMEIPIKYAQVAGGGVLGAKSNRSYAPGSLVGYSGGNRGLEYDVEKRIKERIKILPTDLPKSVRVIALDFVVNHRGKIKKVDITTPMSDNLRTKLEELIKSLDNWEKGKKRISKTYKLYVSLKR